MRANPISRPLAKCHGPVVQAADAKQTKYMSVAERIDQGKVTEAEGMLEFRGARGP